MSRVFLSGHFAFLWFGRRGGVGGGEKSRKGGNVVAVLQMVNKKGGQKFTEQARTLSFFLLFVSRRVEKNLRYVYFVCVCGHTRFPRG